MDWPWTRDSIESTIRKLGEVTEALTSLAVGSDQIFAQVALELGVPIKAFIPFPGYERTFAGDGLQRYNHLLGRCSQVVVLRQEASDEESFLAAGKRVAEESDLLFAVWDGKPAAGVGGTADVVSHARAIGRQVLHINPLAHSIVRLG